MCNVIMTDSMKNLDFVLYNIIFAKCRKNFTVESILNEVKRYFPDVSREILQIKFDNLVSEGLIRQRLIGQYYIV